MIESVFEFAMQEEINCIGRKDNRINGIRILKFRKDILLKNYFFDNKKVFHRLTDDPYEILPIEDMTSKDLKSLEKNKFNLNYRFSENDTTLLFDLYFLLSHGELVKADVLLHNQVLYMEREGNVVYYNEKEDKIKKISKKQIRKQIGFDKDYHTIVLLPWHMQYEHLSLKENIYKYYGENLEKFKSLINEREIGPIVQSMARIKFKSKSKFCPCEKDDIVYVYKNGKLRDRYKVINSKGEILQATRHQLANLPEHMQNKNIRDEYVKKREERLINDQKEGLPFLLTIYAHNAMYLYCTLTSGKDISIPISIIPLFNLEELEGKKSLNRWINIPKWFYKRYIEN